MKISKQGRKECMLSTISAIAGVPLSHVRDRARELTSKTWFRIVTKEPALIYWLTAILLAKEYGIEDKIPSSFQDHLWGNKRRVIPTNKRGSIITTNHDGSSSHIAPFENGLIYSTIKEHPPVPIKEYRKMFVEKSKVRGIWY